MKCALCNYEFDKTDLLCHAGCPLAKQCAVICCPNCGYQVVDESRSHTLGFIRKIQGIWTQKADSIPENAS